MNTHTSSFERPQKYKGEWHYNSVVDIEPSRSRLLLWLQVFPLPHSSGWREVGLSCRCQYLKFRLEEICWFASRKGGLTPDTESGQELYLMWSVGQRGVMVTMIYICLSYFQGIFFEFREQNLETAGTVT